VPDAGLRLEFIHQKRATEVAGQADIRNAEQEYAKAFAEAGLGREGEEVAAVADRVRASAVREHLVAALDDWASITLDPKRRSWLLAVARGADPDLWRDRFRDPKARFDRTALEQLAAEVLGDEAKLKELKPALLAALGGTLFLAKGDAVPLLAAAQTNHPDDFWLNSYLGLALLAKNRGDEAVGCFRAALAVRPDWAAGHNLIAIHFLSKGRLDEGIRELRVALALAPYYAEAHRNLGSASMVKKLWGEAIAEFRAALELDPKHAETHRRLGHALRFKGQLDEAIAEFRAALALDPDHAGTHVSLGALLCDVKRDYDGAIASFRAALDLDPEHVPARVNLGKALRGKGQLDEAIREYRAALDLDPKYPPAHNSLGAFLCDVKRDYDGAIASFRAALALDPKYAVAYCGLGNALAHKGESDEAIKAYRKAIQLEPRGAEQHIGLGIALMKKGRVDAAIGEFRTAIEIDPGLALAHYNLGRTLQVKGQLDEAIQPYRAAIRLRPDLAEAHCNLGQLLREKGQYEEALSLLRRGHELGSRQPGWRYPSAQWVAELKPLADRDRRAIAVLKGEEKAKNASELLRLAHFCSTQKRHPAAAARLYADAFAAEPELADDLAEGDRYRAARAAALAGCGKGRDAAAVDESGRARWRKQALDWLSADLRLWAKKTTGDADDRVAVREALARWQRDPDLAGLRNQDAVAQLPEAEREECQKLWAEVAAVLKQAQEK
jgi:tetratricopeptide (TPR) repeat protein